VWLGNNRGNSYSRKNTKIDPDTQEEEFFSYDFEKLGKYDVPAQIDGVLKKTGVKKVTYFGHSQGTSQIFYALSKYEDDLKDKINLVVAFAPIMRFGESTSATMRNLSKMEGFFEKVIKGMGFYEIAGKHWQQTKGKVCGAVPGICDFIDTFMSDSEYNDSERYKASLSKFPNGISWKELAHYSQEMASGKFERFNYGESKNMKVYGAKTPPTIDLTAIKSVPVAYFVGKQDPLANLADVKWASEQTPTTVHYQEIDNCDHGSYLLGKDMSFLKDVVPLVKKYNGKGKGNKTIRNLWLY